MKNCCKSIDNVYRTGVVFRFEVDTWNKMYPYTFDRRMLKTD